MDDRGFGMMNEIECDYCPSIKPGWMEGGVERFPNMRLPSFTATYRTSVRSKQIRILASRFRKDALR